MWLIRVVFYIYVFLATDKCHWVHHLDPSWNNDRPSQYLHFKPISNPQQSSMCSAEFFPFFPMFVGAGVVNLTDTHLRTADKMLLMCTSSYWLKIWSCSFFWGPWGCFPLRGAPLSSFCFFLEKSSLLTSGHAPAWSLQLNQPLRLQSFQTLKDKSLGNGCHGQCQKLPEKKQELPLMV